MVEQRRHDSARSALLGRVRRVLVLVVLAAAGVATGRLAVTLLETPAPTTAPVRPPAATVPVAEAQRSAGSASARTVRRAAAVLHRWDDRRAAAYARGDPVALRRLYLPGSRAARRDLRVLQAYAERGLVVRGLRTQLLTLEVVEAGRGDLTLAVTDRLVGGHAVGRSSRVALPRDAPSSRVLELSRRGGGWRVASVQDA